METALNTALDANEVKHIILEELRKRLDQLSPLQGGKEYAKFTAEFEVNIKLWRTGEDTPRVTLAWGNMSDTRTEIKPDYPELITEEAVITDAFESQEPNVERVDRGMPLTVQVGDGRGGKHTKKVMIKG